MRKLIVVLMAVLMLVSFTSCNQDKIDELEKKVSEKEAEIAQKEAEKETFTEFVDAFQSVMAIEGAYENVLYKNGYRTSPIKVYYNSDGDYVVPDFTGGDWSIWITQQALLKKPNLTEVQYDKSNTSGSVTYEGTLTKNNFTYKIVDNVIAVKYKTKDSVDYETEPIKLDINGSLSCKKDSDSNSGKVTFSFNGTICGETINISFVATWTNADFIKFTAASINGKDVDLVLLNNVIDGMIPSDGLYKLFSFES